MDMNNHLWYTRFYKYIPLQGRCISFQMFTSKKVNVNAIAIKEPFTITKLLHLTLFNFILR